MAVELEPVGILHTCFKEKFGIPRQPNLVKEATARLEFFPEFAREEAVRSLTGFSHIWLLFIFHKAYGKTKVGWSPMVRPPRLGGNKKVGVFASRSPFRPNPIGMSCVRLNRVEMTEHGPVLHLSGVDILDKTPILDIKPYLPYSDSLPDAKDGFAQGPPHPGLIVTYSKKAITQIKEKNIPNLEAIITGILSNDPRPAYSGGKTADNEGRIRGIRLFDFDLKWQVVDDGARVLSLDPQPCGHNV